MRLLEQVMMIAIESWKMKALVKKKDMCFLMSSMIERERYFS